MVYRWRITQNSVAEFFQFSPANPKISGKFGQYFRGEELRLGDKQAQAVEKVNQ
jgi:hypothetical protein